MKAALQVKTTTISGFVRVNPQNDCKPVAKLVNCFFVLSVLNVFLFYSESLRIRVGLLFTKGVTQNLAQTRKGKKDT